MASPKATKKTANNKPKPTEIELQPDAWDRFETAVGSIAPPK